MTAIPSITRMIELELVKEDVKFYFSAITQLHEQASSSVLIFGWVPYLSLFTVESYQYIQNTFPQYAVLLSEKYNEVIKASRMRVKFLDDKRGKIEEVFELYKWLSEFHKEWHINQHKGILGWLKRLIQCDLGIFAYGERIIGSTHTGLLQLGFEKEDLPQASEAISKEFGPLSFSVSKDYGSYLAQIISLPEFSAIDNNYFQYGLDDTILGYKDVRSVRFLAEIFDGRGSEPINFSLLLFLISVNFARFIVAHLLVGVPIPFFKMKFLLLYHLTLSLTKLQSYCYSKNLLTERSRNFLKQLLSDKSLKKLTSQLKFRNNLIHYRFQQFSI